MLRLHENKPLEYKIVRADDWIMWDELREQATINTPVVSYEIPMYKYNEWERRLLGMPIESSFSIDRMSLRGHTMYDSHGNVIEHIRMQEIISELEKYIEPIYFGFEENNGELDNFFDEFGGDE